MVKLCAKCGTFFNTLTHNAKYCQKCQGNIVYYKPKKAEQRTCLACGKTFMTTQPSRKACNDACRAVLNSKKVFFEKTCEECGTVFKTSTHKKKFCSDACFYIAKSKREKARRQNAVPGSDKS